VAARAIQGLYEACGAAGLDAARAAFGDHQGLLAVEIEVQGASADFAAALGAALARAFEGARELRDAKVRVNAREVPVDTLFPPDEGGSDEVSDVG
jgi:hypothetical protein